jgi:hypothetical protein
MGAVHQFFIPQGCHSHGLFILPHIFYYYNVIVSTNTHQNKGAFVRTLSLLFISKDHVSEVQMMMHFILRHPYLGLT